MKMHATKPVGTIQVDVDELWVYYESISQPLPLELPTLVYQQGIPRLLALFERYNIRATFFICGQDLPAQANTLVEIARLGHEVANHSTSHPNGFARLSRADKRDEIAKTDRLIATATGERPVGFKSPGYSYSTDLSGVLGELGYHYDSSLLPTFYAPLMRGLVNLRPGSRVDSSHFGRVKYGFAPLHPYRPHPRAPQRRLPSDPLENDNWDGVWEVPVTTMPLLRLPFHTTFVLSSGKLLFDAGLRLSLARRVPINYSLHGADVIDAVTTPQLATYRFLTQPWEVRRPLYEYMLKSLSEAYNLVPTKELIGLLDGSERNAPLA